MMQKIKIGNVLLYCEEGTDVKQPADEQHKQMLDIVKLRQEDAYHSRVTTCKNWTAMYQLAESRANIIDWIKLPQHADVLELGAGCGTITQALLKKGASVTCQEENLSYCLVNAERLNAGRIQSGQAVIYAMPFAQCEAALEHPYDAVIAVDFPAAEQEAKQLLQLLRAHLKPEGMLILAAKNKFGLKYWAGNKETYTHHYFAGLENNGVRLYSANSLKKLLDHAGFTQQQFYYPYPDERFARDIYSEWYLPKKGDLNYNIVNYEDDRILLFDEQKVFDSIIEEGQFPFFANAFLCIAVQERQKYEKQQAVYTRYASDRSSAFAVRTEMTGQEVRKWPMYAQGQAHITHIVQAYERLRDQYANTKLRFNRCGLNYDQNGTPYADFELLHGKALQEQVDQAIADGRMQEVYAVLRKMMQFIREGGRQRPFEMTASFQEVFDTAANETILQQTVCSEAADIDLILQNILVEEDGTWNVIDYEWTFFFPVPQNYMIYRTLFFLSKENPQSKELSMEQLLHLADIPQEEAAVYAQMEEAFQRYVTGGLVPYREMVNLLERKFLNVVELKADYDRIAAQNELLKGQGIWKAVRSIKKKLTGNG